LLVLGFERRALLLIRRHSTAWVMPPAFFALVIFKMDSTFLNKILHLCQGWPGPWSSYLHFLHSWNDRCMPHTIFYWLRWDLMNFFWLDWLQVQPGWNTSRQKRACLFYLYYYQIHQVNISHK
jgi:hypothetical protein